MRRLPSDRLVLTTLALAVLVLAAASRAGAQGQIGDARFAIRHDESGIRSLTRVQDTRDTEYLAEGAALGRLVIRYRTTRHGDWREIGDVLIPEPSPAGSVAYTIGRLLPTLAARSTASAAVGAGGLRALNDGLVQAPTGRAGGPGAAGTRPAAVVPDPQAPLFTWSGSRGDTQWVQYTFPGEEEVSRSEVFWVASTGGPRSSSSSPSRSRPSSGSAPPSSSATTSTRTWTRGTRARTATGTRETSRCAGRRTATTCRPG